MTKNEFFILHNNEKGIVILPVDYYKILSSYWILGQDPCTVLLPKYYTLPVSQDHHQLISQLQAAWH